MSSRERFEAWWSKQAKMAKRTAECAAREAAVWSAWKARDAEVERLVEALRDARASLRTISAGAGRDEYLDDMMNVRGYAESRASACDALLREYDEKEKRDE